MFFLKLCLSCFPDLSRSKGVQRQILRQTPGGGGRKTPRPLPCVADPIIERKRRHLHGNQPSGGSTERWQDEDGGACVVFPEVWPDCLPAWWLWWLKSCLCARFVSFSLKKSWRVVFALIEGVVLLEGNKLNTSEAIYGVQTWICVQEGAAKRSSTMYYSMYSSGVTLWSVTDQCCLLKRDSWQLLTMLWMILPAVWRSVGCGRRTVSLRGGARTGEGVAAAVESRMGSKKSFLLSRRKMVWSLFRWKHLNKHGGFFSLGFLGHHCLVIVLLNQLENTMCNIKSTKAFYWERHKRLYWGFK